MNFKPDVPFLLRLSRSVRDYFRVRRSGLFRGSHYLRQLPEVRLKHRFALAHYLWSGERRGNEPFPGFNPIAYWLAREHVVATGESALAHYARMQGEGARGDDTRSPQHPVAVEPTIAAGPAAPTRRPIAIVCHVYFYHVWDEIAERLRRLDVDFDLICTVTDKEPFDEMLARILAFRPDALVVKVPNRGRDIFPFLWLIEKGCLAGYEAVCKIHSKKSIHRLDGDNWRRSLIDSILRDDSTVRAVVECLRSDPALGLVAADCAFLDEEKEWTGNKKRAAEICRRLGIRVEDYPLRFPAGSMYWIAPVVIERLAALRLSAEDFEAEEGQLDKTTAHAFERALGIILRAQALEMRGIGEILNAPRG